MADLYKFLAKTLSIYKLLLRNNVDKAYGFLLQHEGWTVLIFPDQSEDMGGMIAQIASMQREGSKEIKTWIVPNQPATRGSLPLQPSISYYS